MVLLPQFVNGFSNDNTFLSNVHTWSAFTEMYRTAFWMHHYGHPNEKRTKLWAPSYYICLFNQGRLVKGKSVKKGPATAIKYIDGSGRVRYKGTAHLKKSQFLS